MAQIFAKIANFDDFGRNYRPPVFGNCLKLSVSARNSPPFLKLIAYDFGDSGGRDVKNPNPDSYMSRLSPKIANFGAFGRNYPTVTGNGVKWSVDPNSSAPFLRANRIRSRELGRR